MTCAKIHIEDGMRHLINSQPCSGEPLQSNKKNKISREPFNYISHFSLKERETETEREYNYSNEDIKADEGVSSPAKAISKRSEGQEEGHVLHTLRRYHQFLHPNTQYSSNRSSNYQEIYAMPPTISNTSLP